MAETYELPQGKITICFSNDKVSLGILELDPGKEMPEHSRPVDEHLLQLAGTSVLRLGKRYTKLSEGDEFVIPANKSHIHSNSDNKTSLTLWKFEGDITDIINTIRSRNKLVE